MDLGPLAGRIFPAMAAILIEPLEVCSHLDVLKYVSVAHPGFPVGGVDPLGGVDQCFSVKMKELVPVGGCVHRARIHQCACYNICIHRTKKLF